MNEDYSEPGGSNPYDPAAGAVYRWGNPEAYCWPWACVPEEQILLWLLPGSDVRTMETQPLLKI